MKNTLHLIAAIFFVGFIATSCKEKTTKETVKVIETEKASPSTEDKGNYLKVDQDGKVEMKIETE
ncbi:hypothetical protein ACXGQW_11480 [Wenyingzhuangia sp. IMCC45533]